MKNQQGHVGRIWSLYRKGGLTPAIASVFGAQSAQQMAFIRSLVKEQRKQSFETPLHKMEVVVFDLETTGFHPSQGDEIISIGAVVTDGQKISDEKTFYQLVNPQRKIPEHVVQLTGINEEMVQGAPIINTVLGDFLEFIDQRILMAHGTGHDKKFLNAALWRVSRKYLPHRMLDSMMIAKVFRPEQGNYGLDELIQAYNIEDAGRHHALQDAKMTAELWLRFIDEASGRGIQTLGDLYHQLSDRGVGS